MYEGRSLQDVRRRLTPTVGFRDYALSKKPSIKRAAKTLIDNMADQLMETFGPGDDGWKTFGLNDRLSDPEIRLYIEKENEKRSGDGPESIIKDYERQLGRPLTFEERRAVEREFRDRPETKIRKENYYPLGDPYLILILYRAIGKFSNEVVDRLREEKVASRVAFSLRPTGADLNKFDPYAVLRIPPNASLELIKKAIRRMQSEFHSDRSPDASPEELKKIDEKFSRISEAKRAIGTSKDRAKWDAERTMSHALSFMDSNIVVRWQSIGDVMSVAYSLQKTAFEMIDRGNDYTPIIEEIKSSRRLSEPEMRSTSQKSFGSVYQENPKKKVSPEAKNRSVTKTERLWDRYCHSGKFEDLLKAYEALLEAKSQVTQYKHKQQITQGIKQARAELKRHAK